MKPARFECYPARMVLAGVGVSVAVYVLGAYVLSSFGPLAWVAYLAYCGLIELAAMRRSCVHCYYYGKVCCHGRGKVASLLFAQGDPRRFLEREVSFRDIVPDLLVSVIPLVGGAVLLVRGFDWAVLVAMLLLLLLASAGTGFVRGRLACRHCAQRDLGCPALELFDKGSGQEE